MDVLEQHCELIAAESGDGITRSNGLAQAGRHGDQQLVPRAMAKAVVDPLEVVQVEKEHSQPCAGTPPQRVLETIHE